MYIQSFITENFKKFKILVLSSLRGTEVVAAGYYPRYEFILADRNLEYLFCIRPIIDRFKFITSYSIYGANTTVKILTIFVA